MKASWSVEKKYCLVTVLARGALFQDVCEVEINVGVPSISVQLWELILDDNIVTVSGLLSLPLTGLSVFFRGYRISAVLHRNFASQEIFSKLSFISTLVL